MYDDFTNATELMEIKLKQRAGKCSFLILLFGLFTIAATLSFSIILMKGFKCDIGIISKNEYLKIFFQIAPCIVIDIITILIGIKITNLNLKSDILKRSICERKTTAIAMISCGGIIFISSIFNALYMILTDSIGISTPAPDFTLPDKIILKLFYLIYVCMLGPFLEEILFRGIILNYMKKYGDLTAMFFSTILFTMFHLNLIQFMTPLLMGMLLSFLALKADSIKPSIVVHMFNNTMAAIISYVFGINKNIYIFITAIYILGGIIALILFIYKYFGHIYEMLGEEFKILTLSKRIKCCLFNSCSLLYIVFYFTVIIVNFICENLY